MVTMNGEEATAVLPAVAPQLNNHLDDDDDDVMSEGSSPTFDDSNDLMSATMEDEVTAQLAAAGPVGMAAAAAIASAKKRKRPHQFETNPSIRKRQQTRLLRKLRQTIDEFTIRVGMQAVVLVAIPGKPQNSFKCFGAKPLEDVIRQLRPVVMQDLENALAAHAPAPIPDDPSLHELPPLVIDGIPTPVEKMTQAQLRAFIPLMLKYSTGRGKPGWGKESTRPPWWPEDLPWANVRMDARTEDEKQKVSWTHALRQIVINCYKFHGREDLLPVFSGDAEETNPDGKPPAAKISKYGVYGTQMAQFAPTVLQTISNPDGTVSIIQVSSEPIQVDPTNSIITLPDGTTAQVQGVATLQHSSDGTPTVQTLGDVTGHHDGQDMPVTVDLNSATLGQEGQIILTGEDGHAYPVTVSGMITVPVSHLYNSQVQTVVANISSLQAQNSDGTLQQTKYTVVQAPKKVPPRRLQVPKNSQATGIFTIENDVVTPMVLPKVEPGEEGTTTIPVSALTGDPTQTQVVTVNANGQVVHNDKIYQICEFLKGDSQEKVIMMTHIGNQQPEEMNNGNGEQQIHEVQGVETHVISSQEIETQEGETATDQTDNPES